MVAYLDAWSPREIAERIEDAGVQKVRTGARTVLPLAVLAGAFVALGAAFSLVVTSGSTLGLGPTRLLGGLAFCLGLILVVIAGAELFTGNNLVAMAWASGRIRTREVVLHWLLVYAGNVAGALGTAVLVWLAAVHDLGGGAVGEAARALAKTKENLPVPTALARAILCNALVCLAVWLAMGGHTLTDKLLAVLFPVTAFVALGLEHSIANWFFFAYALLLEPRPAGSAGTNLAVVTLGNVLGGTLLVAGVYWTAYLRPAARRRGS